MQRREPASSTALNISQGGRRTFLKSVIAAASTTAGTMFTQAAQSAEREPAPARNCDVYKPSIKDARDKVAFITGGSSGIGLGIARAFVDEGMKVVIGYRTKKHAESAMEFFKDTPKRVHLIQIDVTDRTVMKAAAIESERVFGQIHVLVNNAGIASITKFSATTLDDWDWTMAVNVDGVFNGIHTFLPRILAHGEGGHIIATSSMGGLIGNGTQGAYIASKFAVVGMMESLRTELLNSNIGVSIYCPSFVRSNILDAERNRPANLRSTSENQDSAAIKRLREIMNDPTIAADPLSAGRLVFRGMQNNELYILDDHVDTHPEVERIMRDRGQLIMQSVPKVKRDIRKNTQDLPSKDSIYSRGLERKLCAGQRQASSGILNR